MSVTFTLPQAYAAVAAVGLSTFFLAAYHALLANKWRKSSGIKAPQCYADAQQMKESRAALLFTCAQRAHANMLENLPFLLLSLAWAGLRFPLVSAGVGAIWIIGRVIYAQGYTSGNPGNRQVGFAISTGTLAVLHGMAFYSSWEMYNGR